mgnify:CR=1 FL=1
MSFDDFRKLSPGCLLLMKNGVIGILIERFKWSTSDWPAYAWRVSFNAEPPLAVTYNDRHGWLETNILNGAYGEVVLCEVKG